MYMGISRMGQFLAHLPQLMQLDGASREVSPSVRKSRPESVFFAYCLRL